MAWEKRGRTLQYYVGERADGRVVKSHMGAYSSPAATLASQQAAIAAGFRLQLREFRAPLEAAERAVIDLTALARQAAEETLRSAGCERSRGHWRFPGRPGRPAAGRPALRESVPGDPELADRVTEAVRSAVTTVANLFAKGDPDRLTEACDELRLEIRLTLPAGALPAEQAAAAAAVLARAAAAHGQRLSSSHPWPRGWTERAERRVPQTEAAADRLTALLDRPA